MIKIWITWHRENKFKDWPKIKNEIIKKLEIFIFENWKENILFNLGWANWIDNLIWMYCSLNNIKYDLYLPFSILKKQIEGWTNEQKKEYFTIVKNANQIFYWNWYFDRNRLIVNNSDFIITVFNWNYKSGTGYTINYAKKINKKVINLFWNL